MKKLLSMARWCDLFFFHCKRRNNKYELRSGLEKKGPNWTEIPSSISIGTGESDPAGKAIVKRTALNPQSPHSRRVNTICG